MNVFDTLRRHYRQGGMANRVLAVPVAVRRRWLARQASLAQALVTKLGERIAGDVTMHVPEFEGQFACSPRSDLFSRMVLDGYYEPRLADLFRQHIDPARDIVDVGANIGFYSVLGARLTPHSRVLAVEPNPEALRRLAKNLELNGVSAKVVVYRGVLGAATGSVDLNVIDGMEEYSSVSEIGHASVAGKASRTIQVEAETLDRLVERYRLTPGLIKIDVEGAEGLVFEGAERTLKEFRPIILSEFSPALLRSTPWPPERLLNHLNNLGYRVVDADSGSPDPLTREYGDILCFPE